MTHTPKFGKRSTFGNYVGQNGVFVGGLRRGRFKKSTFWVQKGPLLGVLHLARFDPGYGSGHTNIIIDQYHYLHHHHHHHHHDDKYKNDDDCNQKHTCIPKNISTKSFQLSCSKVSLSNRSRCHRVSPFVTSLLVRDYAVTVSHHLSHRFLYVITRSLLLKDAYIIVCLGSHVSNSSANRHNDVSAFIFLI